jgi:alkylated DNA repair dioxygenase AlkB
MPKAAPIVTPLSAFAKDSNDNIKLQNALRGFSKYSSTVTTHKSKTTYKSKTTHNACIQYPSTLSLSIGTTYGTTQSAFVYNPTFLLDPRQRVPIIKHLAEDIPWSNGKHNEYTYCYGTPMICDTPCVVHWKNFTSIAEPMPHWLKLLCVIVQDVTNKYLISIGLSEIKFNAALLKCHIGGNQRVAEHKDNNRLLQHTTTALLSFGDERNFKVKIPNPTSPDVNIIHKVPLQSGSLALLINGPSHGLLKSKSTETQYDIMFCSVKRPSSDKIVFNEQYNMYECIGDTGFGNHCKYTKQISQ